MEQRSDRPAMRGSDLFDLLACFRRYQFTESESCLRREAHMLLERTAELRTSDYFIIYSSLAEFVRRSIYYLELIQFLFPVFVHFYLQLLEQGHLDEAERFYDRFIGSSDVETLHGQYFYRLRLIGQSADHLHRSFLTDTFRHSRFFLRLSMSSCTAMQTFIDSIKQRLKQHDTSSELNARLLSLLILYDIESTNNR
jgi:hypothetical protein